MEVGEDHPGCRYLDPTWGFCLAYNSAQVRRRVKLIMENMENKHQLSLNSAQTWCLDHLGSSYCKDGGESWAQPPLGSWLEGDQTGWTPGTYPYRGGSANMGEMSCSCMKDCTCNKDKCWCVDPEQQPVGPGGSVFLRACVSVACRARCDTNT